MALKPFDTSKPENQRERVIVYGRAGIGKTRFALSLPDEFGEILYYAADANSEFLQSIDPSQRARVHVLKPYEGNPVINFQEFCVRDWSQHYPKVKTLVVDTYSNIAVQAVQYSANTGAVTKEQHFKVGDPNNGGQVIPNRGDYEAVNSLSRGFINTIFDKQRDYNIIFVCHEDSKKISTGATQGGPAHPGWEMYEEMPSIFNTVIRLIRDPYLVPGASVPEMRVFAVTEHDGLYTAKLRESNYEAGNPLARCALDRNPINFWNRYLEYIKAGNAKQEVVNV